MNRFSPERLRRFRKAAGYTQETFGDAVGCHRLTVLRVENSQMAPSTELLASMASVLSLSLEDFFTEEEGPQGDGACEHNCYGDCWISKVVTWHAHVRSSDCTVECHKYEEVEARYRRIVARLEAERDEATAEIHARKQALMFLAAVELTQMTEGWQD